MGSLDLPPEDQNWGLLFDGDDAGTSPNTDVSLGAAFTVELWVRFDVEERYGVLIDTRAVEVADQGWTFYVDPPTGAYAGHLVFYYNGGDEVGYYLVGPVLDELDDWHHFAAVRRDSGELTIYVDGVAQASDTLAQPVGSGAAKVFIGRQYADDASADSWWRGGVLDDVHVSNTARYVTDFVPEQALVDEDSLYLWRFNEGSGDTAWDEVNGIPLVLDAPEWVFVN